eukprot:8188684-Pyramimonas_sp.AAC.1
MVGRLPSGVRPDSILGPSSCLNETTLPSGPTMPPALCTYPKYTSGIIAPPVLAVLNLESGGGA